VGEKDELPQPIPKVGWPRVQFDGYVPTIRDRVVQTAAKLVLEPIFEADFEDSAYGYRPVRAAVDAVKEVHRLIGRGTATIFPGSRLRIRFTVRPPPRVGLAFPGSPVERSAATAIAPVP
jgi:hypothetical protein